MPKFLVFLLFWCLASQLNSQSFEQELRDAIRTKPKLEFRLDSRNSFISRSSARVFGLKLGLQFDEKLSFGIGYNTLLSDINSEVNYLGVKSNAKLKFYHVSPYVEYVFYRDDKWELSIPIQFGFGSSYLELGNLNNDNQLNKRFIISYEPAITFQYRLAKYFGVGLGIGYRLMIKPNNAIDEQFTSPVYLLKFRIYFQEIIQDIKDN